MHTDKCISRFSSKKAFFETDGDHFRNLQLLEKQRWIMKQPTSFDTSATQSRHLRLMESHRSDRKVPPGKNNVYPEHPEQNRLITCKSTVP